MCGMYSPTKILMQWHVKPRGKGSRKLHYNNIIIYYSKIILMEKSAGLPKFTYTKIRNDIPKHTDLKM